MVHGLETLRRLNEQAVANAKPIEPKAALVSTVDTITAAAFTDHFVMVFENAEHAVSEAIHILLCVGLIQQDENTTQFKLDGEWFESEEEVLEAFQDSLGPTEFFHVKSIIPAVTVFKS